MYGMVAFGCMKAENNLDEYKNTTFDRPRTVERIAVLPESWGPTRRSVLPRDLDFRREKAITSENKNAF